jgi:hypothetical protein
VKVFWSHQLSVISKENRPALNYRKCIKRTYTLHERATTSKPFTFLRYSALPHTDDEGEDNQVGYMIYFNILCNATSATVTYQLYFMDLYRKVQTFLHLFCVSITIHVIFLFRMAVLFTKI